jgi:predicted dehydrogenase
MEEVRPLRIGLIGPGEVADSHLVPALRQVPGALFWSVASRDRGRAETFARRHGAAAPAPAHADEAALLADPDLEAVIIATPDALHARSAVAAAQAGKHVFVEKPMATSLADGRAMLAACQAAGVHLAVGYHLRWHPAHRFLAERLAGGEDGPPRHLRIRWTKQARDATDWRAQDRVARWWALAAYGTHVIDLARFLLAPHCGEVTAVRALFGNARFRGQARHEETAQVTLRFASGVLAELLVSMALPRERAVELECERGRLALRDTLGPGGGRWLGPEGAVEFPGNPYIGELNDFVSAVRDRRPVQGVDGAEGLRNIELLLQAEESNGRDPL